MRYTKSSLSKKGGEPKLTPKASKTDSLQSTWSYLELKTGAYDEKEEGDF